MPQPARSLAAALMLGSLFLACADEDDRGVVSEEGPAAVPAGDDDRDAKGEDADGPPADAASDGAPRVDAATAPRADAAPRDAAVRDGGPLTDATAEPGERSEGGASTPDGAIEDAASVDAGGTSEDDPCEPGMGASAGQSASGRGHGFVEMQVQPPNEYTRLQAKMTVGEKPPKVGTVFVWPGFQPLRAGANFNPVGNGVLQPVLGWGPACPPGGLRDYSSWWISAMYVNVTTREPGYNGCYGSKLMRVEPRDVLDIDIALEGRQWIQRVRNERTGERIEYAIDLMGQQQNRALFWIELPNGTAKPVDDSVFEHVVLTTKLPDRRACSAIARGPRDFVASPRSSKDGLVCCVDRMTLRANGVMATTSPLTAAFLGSPAEEIDEQ